MMSISDLRRKRASTVMPNRRARVWLRQNLTGLGLLAFFARYGALVILAVMCIAFSFSSSSFLTTANLLVVLQQVSIVAVLAGGLTVVLAAGQFDLSIGYAASFAGVLAAGSLGLHGQPLLVSVTIALAFGASVGFVNGFIVSKLKVNALVATLGVGTVTIGLNFLYHSGTAITANIPASFINLTLGTAFFGLPNLVFIAALILLLLWFFLNFTVQGQEIQALGGSEEASLLAGVRVDRVRITAFVITGLCAAAGGVLLASSLAGGESTAADAYLLDAYAAAFLGSAVLRNGEFHIIGTVIGVLTVGVGFNGLALFNAPSPYQYLFKGGILIAAVALSTVARRYAPGADRSSAASGEIDSTPIPAKPADGRASPTGTLQ